jgi:hypothetical protein
MISLIIQLAISQKWYGVSDAVEVAKGKNKYVQSYSQFFEMAKRKIKLWRKM